jgi:hypothetical protein
MILLTHIVIALGSVIYTGFMFLAPTKLKINISYVLLALTIGTGTYLTISTPAHMLQTCITGLSFVVFMLSGIAATKYKLAKAAKISS